VNYSGTKNDSKCGNQLGISNNGDVVFHPNGNFVHSYRIHTGELVASLQGHYERVNCCKFRPHTEVNILFLACSKL
jgi:DNA excision repair protein ERCC-8